ncbi:hypothetical protein [Chryseobacterium sp. Mn2064]|uniref:hypothetical protein n=1 Tax=Chryseobacterium sp. Mn2064 TaxID=3395263 RepID=UPI003BE316DC
MIKKLSVSLLIIVISHFSQINAQEKIYSKNDIGKFEINKKYYLGKKVKDVLSDLKVDIQLIILGGGTVEENNFIAIRFIDNTNNPEVNAKSAKLTLFVKERDHKTNSLFLSTPSGFKRIYKKDEEQYKTNEDLLKAYENLSIIDISASSEKV